MITLVATGVDSPQLATSLSSAQLCLIAIHLQEQEAKCPREKIQTQLMIIHRGVKGPGNRPCQTTQTLRKIPASHAASDQHCPSTHFISTS